MDPKKLELVQQNFASLETALSEEDYEVALTICDRILAEIPNDPDAVNCKAKCLVKDGKFADTLAFIETLPAGSFLFEKAYSLYRLQRTPEALTTLQAIPAAEKSNSVLHLEAQLAYRSQKYDQAVSIYESLFEKDPKNAELQANLLSAIALSNRPQDSTRFLPRPSPDSAYEVLYNGACALARGDQLEQALQCLTFAERACQRHAEEDPEEAAAELAAIQTQRAFVQQLLGREEEALRTYQAVIQAKPADVVLLGVATHNAVTLTAGERGPIESLKQLRGITSEAVMAKLTAAQRTALHCTRALLHIGARKLDQAREALRQAEEADPENEQVPLAKALLAIREKRLPKAEECLKAANLRHPEHSRVAFALAQLYLSMAAAVPHTAARSLEQAARIMAALPPAQKFAPGLMGIQVAILERCGLVAEAAQLLDDALAHWEKAGPKAVGSPYHTLLQAASRFRLQHEQWRQAAQLWRAILQLDPADLAAQAGLVIAESYFDTAAAERDSQGLPAGEAAGAEAIDQLELRADGRKVKKPEAPPAAPAPAAGPAKAAAAAAAADATEVGPQPPALPRMFMPSGPSCLHPASSPPQKKKKRKRKIRLPARYDPSKAPDPLRWLPMRDRDPKRKARQITGTNYQKVTQGSVSVAAVHVPTAKTSEQEARETEAKVRAAAATHGKPKKGGRRR
ncbi:putative Signal recognition particle subunit SRP72 [Paratrimastix pyriformis]|uniref:Signal recognition particle subunit SRP72 n=1 Tax=Paratrimastix pyriformis TaxID=342808 RepID=A0ABQ8UQB0_9EUKA|nr:putative Signal recognition particle subunit SRP72 [Paratrimastix pyriformis]